MFVYLVLMYLVWGPPAVSVTPPVWTTEMIGRVRGSSTQHTALPNSPCAADVPARGGMAQSSLPQLRKLTEYEAVCKGRFSNTQMLFSPMPTTVDEGARLGKSMARSLKEFDMFSVFPLVIMEPATPMGRMLPLSDFGAGTHDASLISYFQTLKDNGVTDAMMGTWVPFPEANTPVWGPTNPALYAKAVNKVASLQKQRFPDSKTSLLLASQSYPTEDTAWKHGAHKSLTPYVDTIRQGLVDSFGYQGFPWTPPATESDEIVLTKPKDFLRTDLVTEAADELEVRDIWFNTGTFGRAYAHNADEMVIVRPAERKDMLDEIVEQALAAEAEGYRVSINLMAEDASHKPEGIDWSYWQPEAVSDNEATPVFQSFVKEAITQDVEVWVYDDDQRGVTPAPQDMPPQP